jgi:hypothetical protein
MKKYILIASTLMVTYMTNAQVNDIPIIGNKFTFGVDGGLAVPSSDYASTTALPGSSGTTDGFAKTGFCYDAYAGFKFSKLIGVMALYGSNINSFNTSKLNSDLPSSWSYSSNGGYTVNEYLIGPYLSIKLTKIKIEVKLLGGLVTSNYPQLSGSSTLNGVTTTVVSSYSTGNGFGYCAGAKVKYMMVGGMLGLGVGLNYVGSDVNFTGQNSTPNSKMNIGIIQATLGVSIDI